MRLARLALCNRPIMPDELAKTYYNVALTIWDGDKYGRIAVKRCLMFLCKSYECGVTNQPLCSPLCPILILDLPTCRCCTQQNRKLNFNQEFPSDFLPLRTTEIDGIEAVDGRISGRVNLLYLYCLYCLS